MFRWYTNATVCYAFLSDVEWSTDPQEVTARFSRSRWFTRGWTLQELIAPANVVFYAAEWVKIGTKAQLSSLITKVTSIDEDILHGGDLTQVCAAKKMFWASRRATSRREDMAYCLVSTPELG